MTITLAINGKQVTINDGATVLDAINQSGGYISQLCKDPDMKPIGACRTCLVQIDGMRGFPASCSVPATEGMSVMTETDEARDTRRGVLELTMAMFPPTATPPLRTTASSPLPPGTTALTPPAGPDASARSLTPPTPSSR